MEIQESIMISGGGGGARESYNDPFPIQDSVMISLTGGGAISSKPLTGNKKGSTLGANTRSYFYSANNNNYSIKYEQEQPRNNTQIRR
jgi:hypothetical protein